MTYAPLKRGTLLIPSGSDSDPDKRHLFVILNEPHGEEGLVLLASFSRYKPHIYFCDDTCLIEGDKKEHSFVIQKSFVRYQKLRLEPASKLTKGVSLGLMTASYPVSVELHERICKGVFTSPFVAPKFRVFLSDALGTYPAPE